VHGVNKEMRMGKLKELLAKTSKKAKAERRPRLAEQSAPAKKTPTLEPVTIGVPDAVAISGLSLRYLREEIRKGNIHTVRKGRRVLITMPDFRSYLGLN
jgi:hypothetical protein